MEENNVYKDFMDYLLNDDKEIYNGELSQPNIDSEENERKISDEILESRMIEYYCCDRFYGNEKLVCDNIKKLSRWVCDEDGLNMKENINFILKNLVQCEDLNKMYQKPLEYLYRTKIIDDIIKKSDGTYYTKKLSNCSLVKDKNGEWSYVNKLNANYSDLSELLTTLFIKGGQIEKLSKMNVSEIKKFLLTLKGNTLTKLLQKYFTLDEYEDYTYNTRNNTKVGDYVENLTKELLLEDGFTLIYEGCNGNFIDMRYGVDFIMEKDGKIHLIQVKRRSSVAKESTTSSKYRYIDIFAGESPDHNGIMLYNRCENFDEKFVGRNVLKKNMNYLKEIYK